MRIYTIKTITPCHVAFVYRVEAENEAEAAELYLNSGADFIREEVGETISFLDHSGFEIAEGDPAAQADGFEAEGVRKAASKLLAACEAAFFQFEHNGDESDSDKDVLNQLQAAIVAAKEAGIAPAPAEKPARFAYTHEPGENPDRAWVLVDGKYDVTLIRTEEGIIVDVYPKDWIDTIATLTVWDDELAELERDAAEGAVQP